MSESAIEPISILEKLDNCPLYSAKLLIGYCGKYCKLNHYFIWNFDGNPCYQEVILGNGIVKITKTIFNKLKIVVNGNWIYEGTYDFKFQSKDLMIEELTKFLNKLSKYAMLM